ncbi:MAG: ABC transporter ATP-binding protein [Eubacteriales bacterium]|nr:ABC transporter ATP-binding protein [Eubacteriales bacterium]
MLKVITELQAQIEKIRKDVDERPDFLAMGYADLKGKSWSEGSNVLGNINKLRFELDKDFLDEFTKDLELAIKLSMEDSVGRKQAALKAMSEAYDSIGETISNSEAEQVAAKLTPLVNEALNNLDVGKDSAALIFAPALDNAVRELKKFRQLSKLREGKKRRKKFRKANLSETTSEEILTQNIKSIINRAMISFENYIEEAEHIEYGGYTQCFLAKLENLSRDKDYKLSGEVAKERAVRYLDEVGIPQPRERFRQYPFELSGGMRQRVVIAIALSSNPDVLICDEPTTALDVTIQAQILDLINDLKVRRNLSVIFITHDLGVVANVSDRIAVMYAGKIVEYGTSEEVFYNPQHPYTWALLASMPDLETKDKLQSIPGTPPDMTFPPKGDAFAARNPYAMEIDFEEQPPLIKISDTHYAATWLLHPDAPKVEPPEIVTNRIKRMTGQDYGEVTLHVPDEEA